MSRAISASSVGRSSAASRPTSLWPLKPHDTSSQSILRLGRGCSVPGGVCTYCNMLTARATTSPIVSSEVSDCRLIRIFANGVKGIVSVGLNAVAFVNDTYR